MVGLELYIFFLQFSNNIYYFVADLNYNIIQTCFLLDEIFEYESICVITITITQEIVLGSFSFPSPIYSIQVAAFL